MRSTSVGFLAIWLCIFGGCERVAIRITGTGVDQPGAFCSGFSLTESQARAFFAKAKPATEKQIHDEFTWLPCFVDGTIARGSGPPLKWRIRAVGIGVVFRSDGTQEWLGCRDCDALFPAK
jgi:hypothetical protein